MTDEVLEASLVEDKLSSADSNMSKKTQATALSTLIFVALFTTLAVINPAEELDIIDGGEVSQGNDEFRPFSVIAPIDTGINVYHDHFRTNETYPQWLLDG